MLGHARNELVPVNRLPVSLLSAIVSYLPFAERVTASTVCNKWRDLLRASEKLWRDPVVTLSAGSDPHLDTRRLLRLAGNQLSTLTMALRSRSQLDDSAALVNGVLPTLRELTLSLPLDMWPAFHEQRGIGVPAPVLERFTVSTVTDSEVYILPNDVFTGSAPRLHTLVLDCSIIPYDAADDAPAFAGVRTIEYRGLAVLNVRQFGALLRIATRLEHLLVMPTIHMTNVDAPSWTIPTSMRRVSVQHSVQRRDNVFEFISRALRRTGELVVVEPWVMVLDAMVLQCGTVTCLDVRWVGASDTLVLTARNARGGAQTGARVDAPTVDRILSVHLSWWAGVTRLTVPDSTWMSLCERCTAGQWPALVSLAIHVSITQQDPAIPYTRLFILQEPTLAALCPALVDASVVHDVRRGRGAYGFVYIRGVDVLVWLNGCKVLRTLTLRGVLLREPSKSDVGTRVHRVEVQANTPDEIRMSEDEASWYVWAFPHEEAYIM